MIKRLLIFYRRATLNTRYKANNGNPKMLKRLLLIATLVAAPSVSASEFNYGMRELDVFSKEAGVLMQYYNQTDRYKVCTFSSGLGGFVFIVPPKTKSDIEVANEYNGEELLSFGEHCFASYNKAHIITTKDIAQWHQQLSASLSADEGPSTYARKGGRKVGSISSVTRQGFNVKVAGQRVGEAYRFNNTSDSLDICTIKNTKNSNNRLFFFALPNTSVTHFVLANKKGVHKIYSGCLALDMVNGQAQFAGDAMPVESLFRYFP